MRSVYADGADGDVQTVFQGLQVNCWCQDSFVAHKTHRDPG